MANLFFERPDEGERALIVHVDFSRDDQREDLREFELLVESAGVEIVGQVTGRRQKPDPGSFIGKGKAEEVLAAIEAVEAEVVLFNHALSPGQQRNLEKAFKRRVIDRTGVILDIFAQRARTHEGKLQVELAQLSHLASRLVRGWTHLERQKGGIGMRGPGETQLESDRRMVRTKIQSIERQLKKVRQQREMGRRSRKRSAVPVVSVVGYTNAGKSTLFNRLTESDVYAEDQLFATLDTTLRQVVLPGFGKAIIADTVGFIRHLPHKLVEAFKATLEETVEADLLMHVVDVANDGWRDAVEQVELVLKEIGADSRPVLMVFNKIDQMGRDPKIEMNESELPNAVWVSAKTGEGFDLLEQAIGACLSGQSVVGVLSLSYAQAVIRAQLYDNNQVLSESSDDDGYKLEVQMPRKELDLFLERNSLSIECFCSESD